MWGRLNGGSRQGRYPRRTDPCKRLGFRHNASLVRQDSVMTPCGVAVRNGANWGIQQGDERGERPSFAGECGGACRKAKNTHSITLTYRRLVTGTTNGSPPANDTSRQGAALASFQLWSLA